jgi:hypothetical protein
MKVGDLVKFKSRRFYDRVFLVVKTEVIGSDQKVWIYPDPDAGPFRARSDLEYDHSNSYIYASFFEVVSESR